MVHLVRKVRANQLNAGKGGERSGEDECNEVNKVNQMKPLTGPDVKVRKSVRIIMFSKFNRVHQGPVISFQWHHSSNPVQQS